jgi:hypothetical protein
MQTITIFGYALRLLQSNSDDEFMPIILRDSIINRENNASVIITPSIREYLICKLEADSAKLTCFREKKSLITVLKKIY